MQRWCQGHWNKQQLWAKNLTLCNILNPNNQHEDHEGEIKGLPSISEWETGIGVRVCLRDFWWKRLARIINPVQGYLPHRARAETVGRTDPPAWHMRTHNSVVKAAEYSEWSKLSLEKTALDSETCPWEAFGKLVCCLYNFCEGWNSLKTAMRLMHLCATRDPGVGTAETNRIVEQVLLNLKTLFLSSPPF